MASPRFDLAAIQSVCILLLIVGFFWVPRVENPVSRKAAEDFIEPTSTEGGAGHSLTEMPSDGQVTTGESDKSLPEMSGSATVDVAMADAMSEFARRGEDRRERQIHEIMVNLRSLDLSLPGKTPLSEVMNICEEWVSLETHQPFLIRPDMTALNDRSGESLYDVSVENINIPAGSMSFRSALDFILSQTPGPELTWAVRQETVFITTFEAANSDSYKYLRNYDVSHLRDLKIALAGMQTERSSVSSLAAAHGILFCVDDPPGFICGTPFTDSMGHVSASGTWSESWEVALLSVIREMSPQSLDWSDGRATIVNNRLLVFQSRHGHESIVRILDVLASVADEMGPIPVR
jgi:hypothetical protein